MTLEELNALPARTSDQQFFDCCASTRWAQAMTTARPYANLTALRNFAEASWAQATEAEQLEAFAAHPLIGDVELLRAKFAANAATAHREQGQVLDADDATLAELARLNLAYRERHGFIFIICASDKTPGEMLSALQTRLPRTTTEEIRAAAAEQLAITQLRLTRLLATAANHS